MNKISTLQIHHPYEAPSDFGAFAPAVHKASTVFFPHVQALRQRSVFNRQAYTYGLHGTPTVYTLEERIASLEGGQFCVLAPSGLAAISIVNLGLLRSGDEVLLPHNVYGPSKEQAHSLLSRWGVACKFYDALDPASLQQQLGPRSRLVWVEAPGSVTMEFPDMRALVDIAKAAGAVCALDNTWGCGIAFCDYDFGFDVSMHALTKYPSGGADVLMGSVVTRDEELHRQLLQAHSILGIGVAANDVELVLRSLPTLDIRYRAHDTSARHLAQWLSQQSPVVQVLHPALPGSPGHEYWKRDCGAAAGLFSIVLDPAFTQQQVDAFVDGLKLFRLGFSWGGPMSLAVPYDLKAMRGEGKGYPGHLVRLCIGLEDTQDLQSDLAQSLSAAFGP